MIELKNCQKVYPNGNIGIQEVNLKFPNKGLVGVYGKSGSGKSTLLNCLGGLDKFTSGEVLLNDEKIFNLSKYSTIIFQEYKLLEEMTLVDNLLIACPNIKEDILDDMLKKFDLYNHKNDKVNAISGGQRQRVEIIRALLQDVDIILCDEPIANLDEENKILILDLLKEFSQEKLILIISHDKEFIQKYTQNYLIIDDGKVIENHIEISSSEIFSPKMISPKRLSFKHSFRFALNNIKKNKFKSIMTFVFSFLSLTMLSILFTVLSMNLSQLFYNSFNEKEVASFTLKPFDNEKKYPSEEDITDEDIQNMKPGIVSYENLNFVFEFNQETNLVRTIWKTTEYNDSYNLEEKEVYISEKLVEKLGNSLDEVVGKEINVGVSMLTIKGIIPNTTEEFIFLMNENTFNQVKGNYMWNNRVSISFGENRIQGVEVYNPYMEEDNLVYNLGRNPQAKDEIALPSRILEKYNLTMENVIGQTITLDVKTKKVNSLEYKIVGVTNNHLVVSSEEFPAFISSYGVDRVEAGSIGMVIFDYSEKMIHKAIDLNLCPVHALTNDILFIYHMLKGFTLVLSILAGIFAVIAIFTILNSTNTSLIKNKKNVGVFISFKIKNTSILNSYWIENLMIGLGSVLLTCIFYPIILSIINSMINKEWSLDIFFLQIKFWIILMMILFSMMVTILGLLIPFKNLLRKQPIDILYDR